jgi:hypothetical protein
MSGAPTTPLNANVVGLFAWHPLTSVTLPEYVASKEVIPANKVLSAAALHSSEVIIKSRPIVGSHDPLERI